MNIAPDHAVLATSALARMARVADEVAAIHAADVDRSGRFPAETFAALKAERLLGVWIPSEYGGEGASLTEIADLCARLGQACGSSAMIYGMHQIKMSSLIRHSDASPWHRDYMRECARDQLLLGSATTEGGIGGDLRNSICAVEVEDGRFRLVKQATCISYGREADAILATCRRSPDAASSDQVMVVCRFGEYTLRQTVGWDTMGMRGTRSEGFELVAEGRAEQIFVQPFSEIAAQSMLAMAHIVWSATWYGIAADTVVKSQNFVRAEARKRPGVVPPGALRLAEVTTSLQKMKAMIVAGIARYEAALIDERLLESMAFIAEMNNLKVATSTLAVEICQQALMITGLAGYRNDGPFTIARNYRDLLSAAIMINNDRILGNTSNLLLMSRVDTTIGA
ncbi:acyl-CoA dehydrogenase [Siculibacillus lacustris]|uniref:Acyl-CoA dehydrogenase n=1 Tax=Siculibacillus lacustris TaxID=1549641 RepID=A0A4Q9VFY4_9HYPH|nr:acyl-CoA dehydrogenase family protein [Siculibacillus lacustris]TBW33876.1 acyl-CoA dehydrogenase [Siculibacillus lacustris]